MRAHDDAMEAFLLKNAAAGPSTPTKTKKRSTGSERVQLSDPPTTNALRLIPTVYKKSNKKTKAVKGEASTSEHVHINMHYLAYCVLNMFLTLPQWNYTAMSGVINKKGGKAPCDFCKSQNDGKFGT